MFLETPTFPACPSYGAQAQPMYSVTVIPTGSGRERRNSNWTRSLLQFDCTVGPRAIDIIQEILEFYHAVGGREFGFRFRDYTDFKSCQIQETATDVDQPAILLPLSTTKYQLTKVYRRGARAQARSILKPISGTILVASAGVAKTEGVDYTLDYTTGIITFGSVVDPATMTWGGEFDVPVRFNSEFPVQIVDQEIQSVQFSLQELRSPYDEATQAFLRHGRASFGFNLVGILTSLNANARSGHAAMTFSQTGDITNTSAGGGFDFVERVPGGAFLQSFGQDEFGNTYQYDGTPAMNRSSDGGLTWSVVTDPAISSPGPLYGQNGKLWLGDLGTAGASYSTDQGASWTPISLNFTGFDTPVQICGDGANLLVALGSDAGVSVSTDNGVTWTSTAHVGSVSVWANNSNLGNYLIWDGSKFVTSGQDTSGDGFVATSPDGVTWTFTSTGTGLGRILGPGLLFDGTHYMCTFQGPIGAHVYIRVATTAAGLATATNIDIALGDTATNSFSGNPRMLIWDGGSQYFCFAAGGQVSHSSNPGTATSWASCDGDYGWAASPVSPSGQTAVAAVYDSVNNAIVTSGGNGVITTRP